METAHEKSKMNLVEIKLRWNEVLDHLEAENRIAWLAFFDARLVSLDNEILKLSFIDAEKLAGSHDFTTVRKPEHRAALENSITQVLGISLAIIVE
jgi:hypothetical protein